MRERELREEFCQNWWNTLKSRVMSCEEDRKQVCSVKREVLWGVETKDFIGTLSYVEITTSGVNCMLKNLRGGKSRSGKGIKKGMELHSFII